MSSAQQPQRITARERWAGAAAPSAQQPQRVTAQERWAAAAAPGALRAPDIAPRTESAPPRRKRRPVVVHPRKPRQPRRPRPAPTPERPAMPAAAELERLLDQREVDVRADRTRDQMRDVQQVLHELRTGAKKHCPICAQSLSLSVLRYLESVIIQQVETLEVDLRYWDQRAEQLRDGDSRGQDDHDATIAATDTDEWGETVDSICGPIEYDDDDLSLPF